MGLFDFFKRNKARAGHNKQDDPGLPYFGQITMNELEGYYKTEIEFNNLKLNIDLNFKNKSIDPYDIENIRDFLKKIDTYDKQNKIFIEKDFNNKASETSEYINFYFEEFYHAELSNIVNFETENIPKEIQLLKKLRLIRIGLYPDGKYDSENYAVFDYSIDIEGEPCNQVLVINTDEKGNLNNITWES